MQTYYHNTTASNPDNITLGYLTEDGDYIASTKNNVLHQRLVVKIKTIGGVICRPWNEYISDVVQQVNKDLKINNLI